MTTTLDMVDEGSAPAVRGSKGVEQKGQRGASSDSVLITDSIRKIIDRGFLRLLPIDQIVLTKRTSNGERTEFFNPRQSSGFEEVSMEELEASIIEDGLIHFPNVRPAKRGGKDVYEVVAGERRVRILKKLVKDNTLVYDESHNEIRPASEVYGDLPCRVLRNANDMKAFRIAFVENSNHRPLGEKDVVDLCEWLLNQDEEVPEGQEPRKFSRKKVAGLLRKSEAWLCHTMAFKSKLDKETLEELFSGKLTRSFCVHLMEYPEDKRPVVKAQAEELARERKEDKIEQAQAEEVEAEVLVEKAQENLKTARQSRNKTQISTAERKLARASEKKQQAQRKVEEVTKAPVTLQQSDIDASALQLGLTPQGTKGLSTKQLHDHWVTELDRLLGEEKVRDPDTSRVFPRRDLLLVRAVAKAISDGDKSPLSVIGGFYKDQGKWGMGGGDALLSRLRETARPSVNDVIDDDFVAEMEAFDDLD